MIFFLEGNRKVGLVFRHCEGRAFEEFFLLFSFTSFSSLLGSGAAYVKEQKGLVSNGEFNTE